MATFSIPQVRVAGISAVVPKREVSNHDYHWISKKEREMLIKTTGVEKRRFVEKGTIASDLCCAAADKLIDELGWDRNEIQLLIFVSQSKDYILPASSPMLQDRLKLPHTCLTLDVNLGCSGWVYGMSVAASMLQASKLKKALLLVGDTSTVSASYRDKSTYPLFGDAGTATALEYDEPATSSMHFNLQSDGSGYQAIIIPDGGLRNLFSKESLKIKKRSKGIYRADCQLILDGVEVFNFALREVAPNIKTLQKELETTNDTYDYFVFHQANLLMNETIRKMLKLDKSKVPYNIQKFGNTSCSSIPLLLVSELREQLQTQKLHLMLSGFGVGLSWGCLDMQTENVCCPALIEY